MACSRRLAVKQNAPSACAKCRRAQRPHLLSQRILGMLPRTTKELSKSTSEQRKLPPNTPQKGAPETIRKQGSLPIPAEAKKTQIADPCTHQIGQRDPKRPPRKAARTPRAAPRRFQGASKRCPGSEDVENVIVGRCTVRNHCVGRSRYTPEQPKNDPTEPLEGNQSVFVTMKSNL